MTQQATGPVPSRHPWRRALNYYRRNSARLVFRRALDVHPARPLISFTFDDFPRTALLAGGEILRRHGVAGTYYVSLGLLGQPSPSGPLCTEQDLSDLLQQGHELGCHTFFHSHSWNTSRHDFHDSVVRNRLALQQILPGAAFESLSYPIGEPRPLTKRDTARYFRCCRAGGQTLNVGKTDLNQLSAFFLEQCGGRLGPVQQLIDENREKQGWLIFATHDVAPGPSRYGCTPEFFESVVEAAVQSGAVVLPVAKALDLIRGR